MIGDDLSRRIVAHLEAGPCPLARLVTDLGADRTEVARRLTALHDDLQIRPTNRGWALRPAYHARHRSTPCH